MSKPTEHREEVPAEPGRSTSSAVRRRLVFGVAAVLPSVYTLSSGAQTAAASNLRCWDRVQHTGGRDLGGIGVMDFEETQRFSTVHDGWLRKEVYTGLSGGQPAYCAMTTQSACLDPIDPTKAAAGSTWIVNGERVVVGAGGMTVEHVGAAPQAYGLVYVDPSGVVATLDPDRSLRLRPVREPCWNSILGGRVSILG
jgi:hypothetical protein